MDITGADGTLVASYNQSAFGNILSGSFSGYHLTTKRYDPDINLYCFFYRWYAPTLGRFTQKDRIRYINRYIYCQNSPINLTDSTGKKIDIECYIGAMISCMFGFAPAPIAGSCTFICTLFGPTLPCWACLGLATGVALIACNSWAKNLCDEENKEPCDSLPQTPELPFPPSPRR